MLLKRGASGLLFLCLRKIKLAYTCRHTTATQLLSQGVPPAKGAEQLGHSVQIFLNVYSEWIDEYSDMDNSILEPAANYNG